MALSKASALLQVLLLLEAGGWPGADGGRRTPWAGEFTAGTLILTQESLDEGPYRYAGVLRRGLDKAEAIEPPSRNDEENCDVKYRIEPSGKRSRLTIVEDSLKITLFKENTVVVAAKVGAQVSAKTWIWKGINFGLLGCLKISSCNGQVVTYSADIDTKVSIKVSWDQDEERLAILIKPIETNIIDVKVEGCKPPWYLSWFKQWQDLLNKGVQEAFQEFADGFEHQSNVPETFSPFEHTFVHYSISGLEWSADYVAFKARAAFTVTENGQNVTFIPASPFKNIKSDFTYGRVYANSSETEDADVIPMHNWMMVSPYDHDSNLLQGVRLSTVFLNSLLWLASVKNLTQHHGVVQVMDSRINGTISFDPPQIKVVEDNLLSVEISHGLVLATCLPLNVPNATEKTLFRAEFYGLAGRGRISMTSASALEKIGVQVNLEDIDLSKMTTKPFEPKLPLPEALEGELVKTSISKLLPVLNQYLDSKPIFLPQNIAPLAASPQLKLLKIGNLGHGYAELLSYCTCDLESGSYFSLCDQRASICKNRKYNRTSNIFDVTTTPATSAEETDIASWKIALKNSMERSRSLVDRIGKVSANFTEFYEKSQSNRSFYSGVLLTLFESSGKCRLEEPGSTAKVYWLWQTSSCTPLYLHGLQTHSFYFYHSDGTLLFDCLTETCQGCQYDLNVNMASDCLLSAKSEDAAKSDCCHHIKDTGQSYKIGSPYVYSWESGPSSAEDGRKIIRQPSVIANVFISSPYCIYHHSYLQPRLLSNHINLGPTGQLAECVRTALGPYIRNEASNDTVTRAHWDCADDCFDCSFKVSNVPLNLCFDHRKEIKVLFTPTIEEIGTIITTKLDHIGGEPSTDQKIYISVSLSVGAISLIIIVLGLWLRNRSKLGLDRPLTMSELKDWGKKSLIDFWTKVTSIILSLVGFRLSSCGSIKTFSRESSTIHVLLEDCTQNMLMLLNGSLAILFAFKWNDDNNPLLIIHGKLTESGNISLSDEILETRQVAEFASRLNNYTFAVNVANATLAFSIVLIWLCTRPHKDSAIEESRRSSWIKIRLFCSSSMLVGIFVVLTAVILDTYFDELVSLKQNTGYFLTDNESMHRMVSQVIRLALNGLSLTVVSFTIVFLFHGVGSGIYCGIVLFRLTHLNWRGPNMEVVTTLLVILTVIQPFICLHPVIIWSQDSNANATFLMLIILIWFLPVLLHVVARAFIRHGLKSCQAKSSEKPYNSRRILPWRPEQQDRSEKENCDTSLRILYFVDGLVQLLQLALFLVTFSLVTHRIIHIELEHNEKRNNLKGFVLPAIVSVFVWMMSISYLLLSLVMIESMRKGDRVKSQLVFEDQNPDTARNLLLLRQSLRRRMQAMDRQSCPATNSQRQMMEDTDLKRMNSVCVPAINQSGLKGHDNADGMQESHGTVQFNNSLRPHSLAFSRPLIPVKPKWLLPQNTPDLVRDEPMEIEFRTQKQDEDIKDMQESHRTEQFNNSLRPHSLAFSRPLIPVKPKWLLPKQTTDFVRDESMELEFRTPKQDKDVKDKDEEPIHEAEAAVQNQDCFLHESFNHGRNDQIENVMAAWKSDSRVSYYFIRVSSFLLESVEYKDPETYGWRIRYRRLFLSIGVTLFLYQSLYAILDTQNYSSKEEIQKILDYFGANLTWPDSGSDLDDVFDLYNTMERMQAFMMLASAIIFLISLVLDFSSHFVQSPMWKSVLFSASRIANFFGSIMVFASVVVVGLPDYLEASHLETICPFCGNDFNRSVRHIAEFSIGLFFACLFTFRLTPILLTIAPALVRASVLIIVHPLLQAGASASLPGTRHEGKADDEIGRLSNLRLSILQQVILFSSLLSFPITFITMAIIHQYQKDQYMTLMIVLFWILPPLILFVGLYFSKKFKRQTFLLYVYYTYNIVYIGLQSAMLFYSMTLAKVLEVVRSLAMEPTFWSGLLSQGFLCTVVISDMLYMTVF